MKRLLIVLAVLLGLAIGPFVPQLIGYVSANIPKTGVVVDDSTGNPMPNVTVIAVAKLRAGPVLVGTSGFENYFQRIVTHTDSNGRFSIRPTWSEFNIHWPSANPEYSWVITVFHVGYAVAGDKPQKELITFGNPWYDNPSMAFSPKYTFRGTSFEITPIRLYQPTLTLKDAANYYSSLQRFATGDERRSQPEFASMRQQGNALLAPWVCGLDEDFRLDAEVRDAILDFPLNDEFATKLKIEYAEAGGYEYFGAAPSTTAGIVCKIITNGRGI
ncbi:hypothetical protein [Dokdonella sp.]|uniref:hypothetical protein n=1 Tax=Dokdonella sp. TaxID=2291710 RepID=UPI003527A4D9